MSRYTRRHLTVTLSDDAGHSWALAPGPGDLSISGLEEGGLEVLETMDGGDFDGFVYGDQKLIEWTLTIELPNQTMTSAVADRLLDWALKTGQVATYTSVDPTVWAVDVAAVFDDGTTTATITLSTNRIIPGSITVSKEGTTVSVSGKCIGGRVIS
jgi:hypothetical protein